MATKKATNIYNKIEMDAANKPLGRFASEVAQVVRGKKSPAFYFNAKPFTHVIIHNIDSLSISEKKLDTHLRRWVTRYPGGLKERRWRDSINLNRKQFFLLTLKRMLPKNKTREAFLKMISFK